MYSEVLELISSTVTAQYKLSLRRKYTRKTFLSFPSSSSYYMHMKLKSSTACHRINESLSSVASMYDSMLLVTFAYFWYFSVQDCDQFTLKSDTGHI